LNPGGLRGDTTPIYKQEGVLEEFLQHLTLKPKLLEVAENRLQKVKVNKNENVLIACGFI